MEIKRNGSQPSAKGPAEWFTETVRINPIFEANPPARTGGVSVTFDPGINDKIDKAYRGKYSRYAVSYVYPMVAPAACDATFKLIPLSSNV